METKRKIRTVTGGFLAIFAVGCCSHYKFAFELESKSVVDAIAKLEKDGYTLIYPQSQEPFIKGNCAEHHSASFVRLSDPSWSYELQLDENCIVTEVECKNRGFEL